MFTRQAAIFIRLTNETNGNVRGYRSPVRGVQIPAGWFLMAMIPTLMAMRTSMLGLLLAQQIQR